MDIATAIQELEKEWEEEKAEGFFGRLRYEGFFDEAGFQRVEDILRAVEIPEGEVLDRRFVEVTWFIPTFMIWQRQAWVHDKKDTQRLDEAINILSAALTSVLGLP